jgi:hypothetical protein
LVEIQLTLAERQEIMLRTMQLLELV